MYQWYQNAAKCYAYFSDLAPDVDVKDALPNCRWFTRGWTLQELIAPEKVHFYNREWENIGSKHEFVDLISSITGIHGDILSGKLRVEYQSVATRMSWAANRKTTRPEDLSYCLLGIFGVNMPLIYGEGSKAFRRLQEEIIKHENDLTIFAWDRWQDEKVPWSLFSPSPSGYANTGGAIRHSRSLIDAAFSITNRGLKLENHVVVKMVSNSEDENQVRYCLALGDLKDWCSDLYLQLAKVGPNVFVRDGPLLVSADDPLPGEPISSCHIHPSNLEDFERLYSSWKRAVHLTQHRQLNILAVRPESHWDETKRLFFGPLYGDTNSVFAALCEVNLGTSTVLVLMCLRFLYFQPPICYLFNATDDNQLLSYLFDYPRADKLSWESIEKQYPEKCFLNQRLEIPLEESTFDISMTVRQGVVPGVSTSEISSLTMSIEEKSDDEMY